MVRLNHVSFFILFAFAGATQVEAETLQDAARLAYINNPQIEVERANADLARERLDEARGQRRPTVTLSGSGGIERLDSNRPFSFGLGSRPIASAQFETSMPLYTGGRIDAGIRQAKAGITASESQLSAAVQTLMLDVVTAYSDVIRDRETIKIRENSVALLTEQVRAAQDRFDVGVVTRTDVAQAEARLEGAVAALSGAEAQLEASEAGYEFLVGQAAGELAPVPEPPQLPETFDAALAIAMVENPDLLALRQNERVAGEAVEAARGEMRPSVSIVGTAGYQENFEDNFEDTSVAALAQATIPLYQGGRVSSSVRQAKLQASQARLQTQNAERQVRAQIAQSWFATLAAERAIIASERQVEAAEIAYEGSQEELAVGVRTTLDVLDQEQQLLEARLGLITARRDFYVASYQLLRAMGRLGYEVVSS